MCFSEARLRLGLRRRRRDLQRLMLYRKILQEWIATAMYGENVSLFSRVRPRHLDVRVDITIVLPLVMGTSQCEHAFPRKN